MSAQDIIQVVTKSTQQNASYHWKQIKKEHPETTNGICSFSFPGQRGPAPDVVSVIGLQFGNKRKIAAHESREYLADLALQCAEVSARQLHDDAQHGLDISHGLQDLVTSAQRVVEIDITH